MSRDVFEIPRPRDTADDIIILVIGPAGVGKTTFINTATTGQDHLWTISHGVDSSSNEVRAFECSYPDDEQGRQIVFVDTPSLYEDGMTLTDIGNSFEQWKEQSPWRYTPVAGILYMQRITDLKMTHPPFDHNAFVGLRDHDLYPKINLITTMWDRVDTETGTSYEEELALRWKRMLTLGSRMAPFMGTADSAWQVIHCLLSSSKEYCHPPQDNSSGRSAAVDNTSLPIIGQTTHPEEMSQSLHISGTSSPNDVRSVQQGGGFRSASTKLEVTNEVPYVHSSLTVGRHPDKAIILMMGTAGHGKSKTINRLLGWNPFEMSTATLGSGAKVIQRTEIPLHDAQTGVTINLAFDGTPGNEDTTYTDRDNNAVLMHRYHEAHFAEDVTLQMISKFTPGDSLSKHGFRGKTYPNAILLFVSWDTIKEDAHNEPRHFTSPIGRTMFSLKGSNLVDLQHTNVIVVVTKSLSFWSEYEDYGDDEDEKKKQWMADAEKKASIIGALQHRAFPTSSSWRIVFIENGGGKNPRGYKSLPNGEMSHQNLFFAIRDLVSTKDKTMAQDIVGMHALRLLTGAESVRSHFPVNPQYKIICQSTLSDTISVGDRGILDLDSDTPPLQDAAPTSTSEQIRRVAHDFLGFAYNPLYGSFSRTCILDLDNQNIQSPRHQFVIRSNDVERDKKFTAAQLRVDFKMRKVATLSSYYPSSSAFESSVSSDSQVYIAAKLTAVAVVPALQPRLSAGVLDRIKALPPWSHNAVGHYYKFFAFYGTHVVLRATLGGVLRIILRSDTKIDEGVVRRILEGDMGFGSRRESSGASMKATDGEEVMVFLDGGRAVASQLPAALKTLFSHVQNSSPESPHSSNTPKFPHSPQVLHSPESPFSPNNPRSPLSNWSNTRLRWVDALEDDSVFCPDDPQTEYWWLYNCAGLTPEQKTNLKLASESYLRARDDPPISTSPAPPSDSRTGPGESMFGAPTPPHTGPYHQAREEGLYMDSAPPITPHPSVVASGQEEQRIYSYTQHPPAQNSESYLQAQERQHMDIARPTTLYPSTETFPQGQSMSTIPTFAPPPPIPASAQPRAQVADRRAEWDREANLKEVDERLERARKHWKLRFEAWI